MGRIYSVSFDDVAVTAAQDLFEITAPSTGMAVLHSVRVGQSSEEGDAAAEMLHVTIQRATASGSGGAAATPRPHAVGHAASAVLAEVNNTTEATTLTPIIEDAFNVQVGWLYQPTPEERIYVPPSGILVVTLPDTVADSITMSGTLTFEELD